MLGRLRMNVDASLQLYQDLGNVIFGHPRRFHIGGNPLQARWWWPRSKYNGKKLENLLRNLIAEAIGVQGEDGQMNDYFPLDEDKCRT
jgi:hypothetical protein